MEHLDVIIVGAGLSGLSAAHELHQLGVIQQSLGTKPTVAILEARSRVGGKVFSKPLGEHWLEQGALFIDEGHHQLLAMARKLGVSLENRYARSHALAVIPRVYLLHGREWMLDELEAYFRPLFEALLRVSKQVDQAQSQALNQLSVQQCVQQLEGVSVPQKADFLALIDSVFSAEYGFHVDELNAHHLFEIDACEQYPIRWLTRHFGAQRYRIKGGNQQLAIALATSIPEDWLRLEHQVTRIDQASCNNFRVTVATANGVMQLVAKQVILAAPINLYREQTDALRELDDPCGKIALHLAEPLPASLASAFRELKWVVTKKCSYTLIALSGSILIGIEKYSH